MKYVDLQFLSKVMLEGEPASRWKENKRYELKGRNKIIAICRCHYVYIKNSKEFIKFPEVRDIIKITLDTRWTQKLKGISIY